MTEVSEAAGGARSSDAALVGSDPSRPAWTRSDLAALACLLACGFVLGLPIWTGGARSYLDNPVHIAELAALARGERWSEIGFAGFALGELHSPLAYGLAAGLVRIGAPLVETYTFALGLGFIAPSVALFVVARRRTTVGRALGLAYLLLVQRPALVGVGSPLGGMWTFGLAVGVLILFIDRLDRAPRGGDVDPGSVALLALIGLLHAFALVAAVCVIAIWTAQSLRSNALTRRRWGTWGAMWGLAAAMSAVYWAPLIQASASGVAGRQALSVPALFVRLLFPSDLLYLVLETPRKAIDASLAGSEALAMGGLLLLGVAGAWRARTRSSTCPSRSLSHIGLGVAGFFLVSLVIAPWVYAPYLGPLSWRMLFWVRVGMALSALAALAPRKEAMAWGPMRAGLAVALMLGGAVLWGQPLRKLHPPALKTAIADVDALFAWLGREASPSWGRLALHDTFSVGRLPDPLRTSHLLAEASLHVDIPVVGAYYEVLPSPTRWVARGGRLFVGHDLRDPEAIMEALEDLEVGAVVTSMPEAESAIAATEAFVPMARFGRHRVWRRRGFSPSWVRTQAPEVRVLAVERELGRLAFDVEVPPEGGGLILSSAWDARWRVVEGPAVTLRAGPEGMMEVQGLPAGRHHVDLRWVAASWPLAITGLGWALWCGLVWRRWSRRRDMRPELDSEPG